MDYLPWKKEGRGDRDVVGQGEVVGGGCSGKEAIGRELFEGEKWEGVLGE